jgi:hypothetical protein
VAWGYNGDGQCNVPPLPPGLTYVEVAAAASTHNVARRSDGSVVAWGDNYLGECVVPALPNGLSYLGIAAGFYHSVALRSDDAIVAWGDDYYGECNVPHLPPEFAYVEVGGGGYKTVARYVGCPTCELPFCLGDAGNRSVPCPCGNNGSPGHGCENSASTGGAALSVHGSVNPDRVVLTTADELPRALSVFVQGRSVLSSPDPFGDGARCIGGALKRIGVKVAVAGSTSYPRSGDAPISVQSAALGDLIRPGTFRYYQVFYRDGNPSFCTPSTFNASNAVMVAW